VTTTAGVRLSVLSPEEASHLLTPTMANLAKKA
jgi:hypothetical protein